MTKKRRVFLALGFVVLGVLLMLSAGAVSASSEGAGVTPYPTITQRAETPQPSGTATWANYSAPVLCPPGSNTVPTSVYPTYNFPTGEATSTTQPTAGSTATATGTPVYTGDGITVHVQASISDYRYGSITGIVQCQNEHGDVISGQDVSLTGHRVVCIGEPSFVTNWNSKPSLTLDWHKQTNTNPNITVYFETDLQHTSGTKSVEWAKDGAGSYSTSYSWASQGYGMGLVGNNAQMTDKIYINACLSTLDNCSVPVVTATPVPATATPMFWTGGGGPGGCVPIGIEPNINNPIAWIAPPQIRNGACLTILSGWWIETPFEINGANGFEIPQMGFCPQYISLSASVLGFSAEWLLTCLLVIQSIFWIANEIRS